MSWPRRNSSPQTLANGSDSGAQRRARAGPLPDSEELCDANSNKMTQGAPVHVCVLVQASYLIYRPAFSLYPLRSYPTFMEFVG